MTTKAKVKASPEPPLPDATAPHDAAVGIEQPASNASQPMEKLRVRQKATADQAMLQAKGADALPVSDYPLKVGPVAANTLDRRELARTRRRAH